MTVVVVLRIWRGGTDTPSLGAVGELSIAARRSHGVTVSSQGLTESTESTKDDIYAIGYYFLFSNTNYFNQLSRDQSCLCVSTSSVQV